jgi:hypothetical protein
MVVCVLHLKHQIETTSGAAMAPGVYAPRAARLSPQPGGHLLPPLRVRTPQFHQEDTT